jgi:DNA polymerase I-like protein with 3'-5' exonuclease and polymerase domains
MNSNHMQRLALVRNLLELTRPLEEIMNPLSVMGWDFEGNGIELEKNHLAMVLQRYLRGELSGSDIESWANQIEGREDVQFESGSQQEINQILYELANSELTQQLDKTRAKILFEQLKIRKI